LIAASAIGGQCGRPAIFPNQELSTQDREIMASLRTPAEKIGSVRYNVGLDLRFHRALKTCPKVTGCESDTVPA
jgi:hypothetical protein